MDQPHTPALPYTLATLKGGAQGLFYTSQVTSLAHVIIVIGVGYLDEPESTPGLAHLLEHVLLTQPGDKGNSLIAFAEQLGGKLNARTDDLITDIHATVPVASLAPFLAYLSQALFAPTFNEATIASESTAIDAEYHARLGTPAMRRLAGLQALASNDHPGAFCHHGSRHSLERPPELLKSELERFHGRYYLASLISVGLAASLTQAHQQALLTSFLSSNRPSPHHRPRPWSTRWGHTKRQVEIEGNESSLELFWPFEGASLARQMDILKASELTLNAGALTEPLAGVADDYQVTLCPSGATDTLSLTIQVLPGRQGELSNRIASIAQVVKRSLRVPADRSSTSLNRTSLADWLFTQTRQQALAQRFATQHPAKSEPRLLIDATPYALLTLPRRASAPPLPLNERTTPPVSVISKVGDSGCAGLPAHWFACFYPAKKMVLPALAQKRMAAQGISLLQNTAPQGSWLCAHSEQPLSKALSEIMTQAWLTGLPSPNGLQAHRLLASLTPSPATPFIWASSTQTAAALSPVLAALLEAQAPYTSSAATAISHLVTLMHTLTLPGSTANRRVMAIAAKRHSTPFFHTVRQAHRLGYIAAVRFIDGDPASMAYIVQCPQIDSPRVKSLIQEEINRLWADLLSDLAAEWPLAHEEFMGIDIPETPAAVLVAQWHAHLNATHTPLYRLSRPEPSSLSVEIWRQWLADPAHWAWWQREG